MVSFVFLQTDIVIYSREPQRYMLIRIYIRTDGREKSGSNQYSPKLGIKINVLGLKLKWLMEFKRKQSNETPNITLK